MEEVTGIAALGIDWKLLLAQIVNFLILLSILYFFLYKPILDILEKRRQKVEQSVKDANKIAEDKIACEKQTAEKLSDAQKKANQILASAERQASDLKNQAKTDAQSEADRIFEKNQQNLVDQKQKMQKEVQGQAENLAFELSEKILREKINPGKQTDFENQAIKEL